MLDTLERTLIAPGCFGDLEPEFDTNFSVDIISHLETVASQGSVGRHFQNALGYIMRSMEKVNG